MDDIFENYDHCMQDVINICSCAKGWGSGAGH